MRCTRPAPRSLPRSSSASRSRKTWRKSYGTICAACMTSWSALSLTAIIAAAAVELRALVVVEVDFPVPSISQGDDALEFPPAHIRDRAISRDDHAALSLHVDGVEILAGDLHGITSPAALAK